MNRVVVDVNGKHLTYQTKKSLNIGDKVAVPTPYFLIGVDGRGSSMMCEVVSLTSDYTGSCVTI